MVEDNPVKLTSAAKKIYVQVGHQAINVLEALEKFPENEFDILLVGLAPRL